MIYTYGINYGTSNTDTTSGTSSPMQTHSVYVFSTQCAYCMHVLASSYSYTDTIEVEGLVS